MNVSQFISLLHRNRKLTAEERSKVLRFAVSKQEKRVLNLIMSKEDAFTVIRRLDPKLYRYAAEMAECIVSLFCKGLDIPIRCNSCGEDSSDNFDVSQSIKFCKNCLEQFGKPKMCSICCGQSYHGDIITTTIFTEKAAGDKMIPFFAVGSIVARYHGNKISKNIKQLIARGHAINKSFFRCSECSDRHMLVPTIIPTSTDVLKTEEEEV